jgi:hypothetical protein
MLSAALVAALLSAAPLQPLIRGSVIVPGQPRRNLADALAANYTVTPTGAPTGRLIADQLGDTGSVKDFGAKGDGLTDDTAALNLAGSSGKALTVPPGTYKLTGTIILGSGSSFVCHQPGTCVLSFAGGAPDVTTRAIRLDGAGSGLDGLAVSVSGGDFRSSVQFRAARTFVKRCTFAHTTNDVPAGQTVYVLLAAHTSSVPDVVIEDNDITLQNVPQGDGVQASNAPRIRVVGNRVHDFTLDSPSQFWWGIYLGAGCYPSLIKDNDVRNLPGGGIHINETPANEALNAGRRILHNVVDTVAYACLSIEYANAALIEGNFLARCDYPIQNTASRNLVITGNTIEDVANLGTPLDVDQPMMGVRAPGTVITGNTFGKRGTAFTGVSLSAAEVSVTGNTFGADAPRTAVLTNASSPNALLAANVVRATTDATAHHVFNVNATKSRVTGNTFAGDAAASSMVRVAANDCAVSGNIFASGGTAVFVGGGVSNALIEGNVFAVTTAISDSGTATLKRRNVISGKPTQASGKATLNGTGAQTAFTIAHGLAAAPTAVVVTAGSAAANGVHYATADATNITVTFAVAPATGTGNVVLNWSAEAN